MYDLNKAMPNEIMIYGIATVFIIITIGLIITEYYKIKNKRRTIE